MTAINSSVDNLFGMNSRLACVWEGVSHMHHCAAAPGGALMCFLLYFCSTGLARRTWCSAPRAWWAASSGARGTPLNRCANQGRSNRLLDAGHAFAACVNVIKLLARSRHFGWGGEVQIPCMCCVHGWAHGAADSAPNWRHGPD